MGMPLTRMDNVLIVVEDLEAVKAFFSELGLAFEGQATIEGPMVGDRMGLKDVKATLARLRTPDGHVAIIVGLAEEIPKRPEARAKPARRGKAAPKATRPPSKRKR